MLLCTNYIRKCTMEKKWNYNIFQSMRWLCGLSTTHKIFWWTLAVYGSGFTFIKNHFLWIIKRIVSKFSFEKCFRHDFLIKKCFFGVLIFGLESRKFFWWSFGGLNIWWKFDFWMCSAKFTCKVLISRYNLSTKWGNSAIHY